MSDDIERIQQVFNRCAAIMVEREQSYGPQWKKYGWRGALYSARRKVERAWATLWDAEPPSQVEVTNFGDAEPTYIGDRDLDVDDLLDTINYCAMAVLAVEDGNRDGTGSWW